MSVTKYFLVFFLILIISMNGHSYETDDYTALLEVKDQLKDEVETFDRLVNTGLQVVIENWEGPRNDLLFVELASKLFANQEIEIWIESSPQVNTWGDKCAGIYRNTGMESYISQYHGTSKSLKLNQVIFGGDKLSHFFGIGKMIYFAYEENKSTLSASERWAKASYYNQSTESWRFGGAFFINVFSNADLVANYEGFLFFQSLLKDNIVPNKKSIISWKGDTPYLQRPFTFKDHVNDFWNEAYLPSWYKSEKLKGEVYKVLRSYCQHPNYRPEQFKSQNHEKLNKKYSSLLYFQWGGQKNRLDQICSQKNRPLVNYDYNVWKSDNRCQPQNKVQSLTLESIRTRLPLPRCNRYMEKMYNDHDLMLEWRDQKVTSFEAQFESHLRNQNSENPNWHLDLLERWLLQLDKFTDDELNQLQYFSKNSFSIEINGDWYPLSIRLQKPSKDHTNICFRSSVPVKPLLDWYVLKPRYKIFVQSCYKINNQNLNFTKTTRYQFKNKYRKRYSLDEVDYFPMEDKIGFIYRGLHLFCKWK